MLLFFVLLKSLVNKELSVFSTPFFIFFTFCVFIFSIVDLIFHSLASLFITKYKLIRCWQPVRNLLWFMLMIPPPPLFFSFLFKKLPCFFSHSKWKWLFFNLLFSTQAYHPIAFWTYFKFNFIYRKNTEAGLNVNINIISWI